MQKSIYRLKQASTLWNIRFDQEIKLLGFEQKSDEPCVYKRCQEKVVTFLMRYVDYILLIGNDVGTLSMVKILLSNQFDMRLGRSNIHHKNQAFAGSQE